VENVSSNACDVYFWSIKEGRLKMSYIIPIDKSKGALLVTVTPIDVPIVQTNPVNITSTVTTTVI
jgi:hypothetical protein